MRLSLACMGVLGCLTAACSGAPGRLAQTTLSFTNRASIVNDPIVAISPQSDLLHDTRNLFCTGTLIDGTASANNCQDWTAHGGTNIATVGRVDTSGQGWVDAR